MRGAQDMARELGKIEFVLARVDQHFQHEAQMNAALHMSEQVRPAPLASAVEGALADVRRLGKECEDDAVAALDRPEMPDDLRALARRLQELTGEEVFMTTDEPYRAKVRRNRPDDKPWDEQEVIAEAPTWADLCDRTRDAIEVRLLNRRVTA